MGPAPRDTIFALASGQGQAGIAVIRVSGPRADPVLGDITDRPLPEPGHVAVRNILDPQAGRLDEALILRFAEGRGYTGETAFEIHCHGGRAVVLSILDLLSRQPGCRLAEAGEFTRRAVGAGRMDLLSAEALGDLISAETEAQRRQAIRGTAGGLQDLAESWRADLIRATALVEVTIDWADEEVPEDVSPEVHMLIARVHDRLAAQDRTAATAERLRHGFEVAIVGAPNAGKSTLLNALAGREAAIASAHAGTTRDVIELRYDLAGLPVIFLDMAGLRQTDDPIERIGVERAWQRAEQADLRLFLAAPGIPHVATDLRRPGDLTVWCKRDLAEGEADLSISAQSGDGLDRLTAAIGAELGARMTDLGLVGHVRQRDCLARAMAALSEAERTGAAPELLAESLRQALYALDMLVGRVDVEDVLDHVFANFCLGK